MNLYLKNRVKGGWLPRFAVAISLISGVLALSSTPAFAATCGSTQDATSGPASCTTSISAQVNSGGLTMTSDAAVAVSGSPFTLSGSNVTGTFSFSSNINDHRGSTAGWALEASTTGLTNGATTLPLSLNTLDATSGCTNGSCAPVAFTPVNLYPNSSPVLFLTAGNASGTVVVDGNYTNKIDGQFIIPQGSPAGTYNGTIQLTLLNSY